MVLFLPAVVSAQDGLPRDALRVSCVRLPCTPFLVEAPATHCFSPTLRYFLGGAGPTQRVHLRVSTATREWRWSDRSSPRVRLHLYSRLGLEGNGGGFIGEESVTGSLVNVAA